MPNPPAQRGPPRHPVDRQLLAGSPGQALPRGGQKVVQALPSLRGAIRWSLSVGVGLDGQGREVVTVFPTNLSSVSPENCPASRVAKGSGPPTIHPPRPYTILKPCSHENLPYIPSLEKCWPLWLRSRGS